MGLVGVGYEGLSADELVEQLRALGVSVVGDIRLTPSSRKPGMSKRHLAERLHAEGIDYQHFPALGNPRDNRGGYADLGNDAVRQNYRERLKTAEAEHSLARIRELAVPGVVALLCVEADGQRCHRQQVLDYVG